MNTITIQRLPRFIAVALALALSVGIVLASLLMMPTAARADTAPLDPANPSTPATVSADALPTTQIDGVAWSQVVVGDTVYVAGSFTTARPAGSAPGVNTVTRNNLLAYNITTGALITSFAPSLNAQALAITASPDGSRIYVAGDFTAIDGVPYYRLAAFNTATGAVIPSFRPILSAQARSVTATNSGVYVGGVFKSVNSQPRGFAAQIKASDGSLTAWNPQANSTIQASALTPDGSKLIIGGRFDTLGTTEALGLGAVDATTGAILPWAMNQKVHDYGDKAAITSLYATSDRIYGVGYDFGSGHPQNLEGMFSADPNTGEMIWLEDCHGDSYSVFSMGDVVYDAGHPHYCGNIGGFPQTSPKWTFHHTVAFSKVATGTITNDPYGYPNWAGNPSPTLLNWFPNYVTGSYTGQGQAAWSLAGNSQYLVAGGEFPYVNGIAQQGLTRYAVPAIAPNKVGPNTNTALVPNVASFTSGEARISWTATYDQDNTNLVYSLVRDRAANTNPIYTTTQASTFWQRASMGFIDKGLVPGSTHTYKIFVTDPYGNSTSRPSTPVTISSAVGGGDYATAISADSPTTYWPLDETSGTAGLDHAGFNDLLVSGGVTRGAASPISTATATTFDGATGTAASQNSLVSPDNFTTEVWVRTASNSGGKIIGYGSAATGNSGSYDRQTYMDNSGHITFGVYTGNTATVTSSESFNDGAWHQVVSSLGSNGMRLWIDGKLAGSRSDVTSGQPYSGYWRIGGDNLGGWPNQPSSYYLNGDIAQVSVFPAVLTKQQVVNHFVASGRTSPIPTAPTDTYGAAIYSADPVLFWRLGESSGTAAADSGQEGNPGTYYDGVTQSVAGPISGNTAAGFGSGAVVSSNSSFNNPSTYSLETWFKTTTHSGGKLIGFGNNQSGLSDNYDRHVYMQDDGTLVFGTYTGQTNTVTSPASYNDGSWHHTVATQSGDGMKLYVDGVLVGTNPQTSAQDYSGYWRIGGDNTWGSSSPWFDGTLDEVAVYGDSLTAKTVGDHYSLGTTGALPNAKPTAVFTALVDHQDAAFDATTSSDPDGTIASYAWDFGDGTTGTGATTTHHYTQTGSFVIALTVTDNQGAISTETHSLTAIAPNVAPTALFTSNINELAATFDGSASSDTDGTIATYAWVFGDGSIGTGATTNHVYAVGGTYTVTLTVTDNEGMTGTVNHSVVAIAPNQAPTAAFSTSAANLVASFDAANSADPDGAVVSYAWDFGDAATGSGKTTDHTYALAGSYVVALTVTDDRGATSTVTNSITVSAANVAPTASFTSTTSDATATFDASASTDPDGSLATYAWNFGDGTTGSGATTSHIYASSGSYNVTLVVTDNKGATGTVDHSVAVVAANALPVAAFTSTANNLVAAFDGSTSADPDGTISSYAWNFGDSQVGTGATVSHTYTAAGSYSVSLTVTDNMGATAVISRPVTVNAAPAAGTLAHDAFGRTATSSWGAADLGGAWTVTGGASNFQVANGVGKITIPGGQTRFATLGSVSSIDTDVRMSVSIDALPSAGGSYTDVFGRKIGSSSYDGEVVIKTNGSVLLVLEQGATPLKSVTVAGLTYTPGTKLNVRVLTTGTSPTTINAKVWAAGQAEPGAWQITTTDSTAALQAAGSIGISSYVSSIATGSVSTSFDDFIATTSAAPVTNQAPVAAFTSTVANLAATFDGSTSSDADGSVTGYAWNYGDGATGIGATSSHAYATAGTFTASLTVTDNQGATTTVTHPVTVTAVAANLPPSAAFTSSVANLAASFNGSTSSDPDGTIASYSWNFGDGQTSTGSNAAHSYATAGTFTVSLTVTDNKGATATITHPVTAVAPTTPPVTVTAKADFGTAATRSWGTADVGGVWTNSAPAASYLVADGVGKHVVAAGAGVTSMLSSVNSTSTDLTTTFTTDQSSTGGGLFVSGIGRNVGTSNYQATVWIQSNGVPQLKLMQGDTALKVANLSGITYAAGTVLQLRVQVYGTSPTTIRAKLWSVGQTEPTAWQLSTTDTTAALQVAGSVGLRSYLSGLATAVPVTFSYDNFLVTPQQ
ncbi:PKD domain-containing protein [Glaciihabitans sp. UYNi722]|uniref:beta strand repeat-containing protein n=1 Tax=Glaciihabitans sp. UYNi722 TaxID=3156344 RepID=UPI00339AEF71